VTRKVDVAVANCKQEAEKSTAKEVEFVYLLLTDNNTKTFTMKRSLAASALVTAASLGYSTVVRSLVNLGFDVSARSGPREESALHFAASRGDEGLVSFLLEKGADVESLDTKLRSALHCASWSGHDIVVRLLLENGADVNARDDQDRTALYGAAGGGHVAVVKMLLFWKADIHIKGGTKKDSALERAEKRAFHDVAALLRKDKSLGVVAT
jgi:Ankyrin repeats (3 copies)